MKFNTCLTYAIGLNWYRNTSSGNGYSLNVKIKVGKNIRLIKSELQYSQLF